jgi:isocitrate/isopropylmalate dehydrogenase
MPKRTVVVIEGEDASPEAMQPSVALMRELCPEIRWMRPPVGAQGIEEHGSVFPDVAREAIDHSDATFFGSTSGPSAAALMYLRWGRKTYANVRPARFLRGYRSPLARPEGIDFVIVRENLEDLYLGLEGPVEDLAPLSLVGRTSRAPIREMAPAVWALKVISEAGTERVARFAFELARRRKARGHPGRVACATKHNMLPKSDGLFKQVTERVATGYPDVELQCFIVDDFAHRMIADPQALDVVVTPNLYGDILSDAAAALVGGLGLAASGCYGDDYAYFESAHGTAPDIAGRHVINPTATLLSGAMMLEHLGFSRESRRLTAALERIYREGRVLTPDQSGSATTEEFCAELARLLEAA